MNKPALRSAAVSDPGNVRGNNEDRVHNDDERGIYVVIDGVGGEAAGEHAAAIAEMELLARLDRKTGAVEDRIREGIALAGKRIFEQARRNPDLAGMSCVLTVAVVSDGEAVVGHVGDTRLYKIHNGTIEKVTRDHSPVGVREDSGEISEFEAMRHPRRNEIFRDVGSAEHSPDEDGFIDVRRIPFEKDSALLLCSDGLTDQVLSSEIAETVDRHAGDPWRVARELVLRANEAGGKDNVSVVYVEGPQFAPRVDAAAEAETVIPRKPRRAAPLIAAILGGILLGLGGAIVLRDRILGTGPPPITERRFLTVSADSASGFRTIAEAIESARPGDTVEVLPGTYRERVRLKDGVRVVARPAGGALIQPKPDAGEASAAIVAEGLRSGVVSGFRISGSGADAMPTGLLVADSDVEIQDIEIEGAASAALLVRGASNAVIRASYIHDNRGAGIVVEGAATPRLISNIVVNNGESAEKRRSSLEIAPAARPTLLGNYIASRFRALSWDAPPDILPLVRKQNHIVEAAGVSRRPARRTP